MKLLLDTHAFLWFVWDDAKLGANAKTVIEDSSNVKFLCVASCWEIAIKASLGKLRLDSPSAEFISRELIANGFHLLSISLAHATSVETLPFDHRDPFDRLLVAQAVAEQMTLVSRDSIFDAYGVPRSW